MGGRCERANRRPGGFTLLEVLLVTAIMGMLAALVVPNLVYQGEQAKVGVARVLVASGGALATEINLYKLKTGRYPASLGDLCRKPTDPPETAADNPAPFIGDPSSFRDPWGQELQYKCPGEVNKEGFDLYSFGPDMREGGGDDIGNWTATSSR